MKAFVRDRCTLGAGHQVRIAALFEAYQEWYEEEGIKPGTKQSFGRDLRAAVPDVADRKRRVGHVRFREYVGIALSKGGVDGADD